MSGYPPRMMESGTNRQVSRIEARSYAHWETVDLHSTHSFYKNSTVLHLPNPPSRVHVLGLGEGLTEKELRDSVDHENLAEDEKEAFCAMPMVREGLSIRGKYSRRRR